MKSVGGFRPPSSAWGKDYASAVPPVSPVQPASLSGDRPLSQFSFDEVTQKELVGVRGALGRQFEQMDAQNERNDMQLITLAARVVNAKGDLGQDKQLLEDLTADYKHGAEALNRKIEAPMLDGKPDEVRVLLQPYVGKTLQEVVTGVGGDVAAELQSARSEIDRERALIARSLQSSRTRF